MKNKFSKQSKDRLKTCNYLLQIVFNRVVENFDCTILCGYRNCEDQDKAYAEGKSEKKFPTSKHNRMPSNAVDAAPYPIDWSDIDRFKIFGGYVLGMADALGIKLRWGGDWNRDKKSSKKERDYGHFELI